MADQTTEKPEAPAPAPASDVAAVTATDDKKADEAGSASTAEAKPEEKDTSTKTDEPKEGAAENPDKTAEEPKAAAEGDTEMADAPAATAAAEADQSALEGATTTKIPTKPASSNRRKSGGGGATRKSLSKKNSKARMTHLDAKPGDYFLVKLKGFPEWPAIICEESMLPQALLTSRPVTAARPDGTYVEAYADGGKRVNDRNFAVMYLHTNEFGWVINTALTELTSEMALSAMEGKIRKDLKAAFELAAEQHPLEHYKDILHKFEEDLLAQEEAKKAAAATPKKSKKGKAKDADEDVEMADADESSTAKAKKRKAEDGENAPQRSESVKKPKIKLNTSSTPKAANGAAAPAKEASATKPSKQQKPKKSGEKKVEPKLTPEERHARKEKEVLYLRHKLQRGLLTGDSTPQESDMKQMAEYITLLENFSGMEVSIIRATKINKVLKAILKLETIPREEEFNFKGRSKILLDKWNKLMADGAAAPADAPVNGVTNGTSEAHAEEKKSEPADSAAKTEKEAEPKPESKSGSEKPAEESSTKPTEPEKPSTEDNAEEKAEEPAEKAAAAPEAVESAA